MTQPGRSRSSPSSPTTKHSARTPHVSPTARGASPWSARPTPIQHPRGGKAPPPPPPARGPWRGRRSTGRRPAPSPAPRPPARPRCRAPPAPGATEPTARDMAVASSCSAVPRSPRSEPSTDATENPAPISATMSSEGEERVGQAAAGLGDHRLQVGVVAHQVTHVLAHRPVGHAGRRQAERPADQAGPLQPQHQPPRSAQPARRGASGRGDQATAQAAPGQQRVGDRHQHDAGRGHQPERPPALARRAAPTGPTPSATASSGRRCRCRPRPARCRRRRAAHP